MNYKDELKDIVHWYKTLTPFVRISLITVLFGAILLAAKAIGALVAPLILTVFWSLATIENRTLSIKALFLAGLIGLFGLLPLAGLISSLLVFFWHNSLSATVVVNSIIESLLLLACLMMLLFWPKSRLRLSASILDFAMVGLWLGAGLELGISFLGHQGMTFNGINYGLWPQLPGLLGHINRPFAALAPSALGLLLGNLIGLMRYLVGPMIKDQFKQVIIALVFIFILLWITLERLAFSSEQLGSLATIMYKMDLQGRLLLYLTYVLTSILIVVEWLLLSGLAAMSNFKTTLATYQRFWSKGEQTTLFIRIANVVELAARRRVMREMALAQDIQDLLSDEDRLKANQRFEELKQVLNKGGQ